MNGGSGDRSEGRVRGEGRVGGGGRNRPRREGRVRGEGRVRVGSSSSKSFLYVTFRIINK